MMKPRLTIGVELAVLGLSGSFEVESSEKLIDVARRALGSFIPDLEEQDTCRLTNSCGLDLVLGKSVEEAELEDGSILKLTLAF